MEKEIPYSSKESPSGWLDSRTHLRRQTSPRTRLFTLLVFLGGAFWLIWNDSLSSVQTRLSDTVLYKSQYGLTSDGSRVWRKLYPSPKNTEEETINLIQELYELMETMGYLKPNSIVYPPHTSKTINRTVTAELGLYPATVDFLERLPYVKTASQAPDDKQPVISQVTNWNAAGYRNTFLLSGSFADLTDDKSLRRSRDTWCSDQGVEIPNLDEHRRRGCDPGQDYKMKSLPRDLVSLTVAEHIFHYMPFKSPPTTGSVIIDIKKNLLYAVGWEATGPDWWRQRYGFEQAETRGSIEPASMGSIPGRDRGMIRGYPSRPATEALRDYIERFRSLEWVPSFQANNTMTARAEDVYRNLYKKHGWPKTFNKNAFEFARQAWTWREYERWKAAYPLSEFLAAELTYSQATIRQEEIEALSKSGEAQIDPVKLSELAKDVLTYGAQMERWKKEVEKLDAEVVREAKEAYSSHWGKFALDMRWYDEYEEWRKQNNLPRRPQFRGTL